MNYALLCVAGWLCLLLSGCDPQMPRDPFSKELMDESGLQKLCLIYSSVPSPADTNVLEHFHFESLAWKSKNGSNWINKFTISREQFENGIPRVVLVSDIARFDPKSGNATIKVGLGNATTNGSTIREDITYSWCEWNTQSNHEVRVIRVCKDPFEPLELTWSFKLGRLLKPAWKGP